MQKKAMVLTAAVAVSWVVVYWTGYLVGQMKRDLSETKAAFTEMAQTPPPPPPEPPRPPVVMTPQSGGYVARETVVEGHPPVELIGMEWVSKQYQALGLGEYAALPDGRELRNFCPGQIVHSGDVGARMAAEGFTHATAEDLLRYSMNEQHIVDGRMTYALGTIWIDPRNDKANVPWMTERIPAAASLPPVRNLDAMWYEEGLGMSLSRNNCLLGARQLPSPTP